VAVKILLTIRGDGTMMKAVPTMAMTAFFAALALDIAIPAAVLLGLAAVREIGLELGSLPVVQGRTA
jgi:hypothetical protein